MASTKAPTGHKQIRKTNTSICSSYIFIDRNTTISVTTLNETAAREAKNKIRNSFPTGELHKKPKRTLPTLVKKSAESEGES